PSHMLIRPRASGGGSSTPAAHAGPLGARRPTCTLVHTPSPPESGGAAASGLLPVLSESPSSPLRAVTADRRLSADPGPPRRSNRRSVAPRDSAPPPLAAVCPPGRAGPATPGLMV